MSFSMPDTIVLERDLKAVISQFEQVVNGELPVNSLSEAAQLIVNANPSVLESKGLSGLLDELRTLADSTLVFDVILATYPHDSFLSDISTWFRREIHPLSMLKISVRRSICGGMVVRSKNRIFDMSLRPKVVAARDKFPEIMRRV